MMPDAAKWAIVDLLRALDVELDGRLHTEFGRIAATLGVSIPPMAPLPDQASDGEAEINGEDASSEQDRVLQFLAAQTEPVSLAQIIAELGLKKWTATSSLTRLQRKGLVQHAGYDAWRVRGAE